MDKNTMIYILYYSLRIIIYFKVRKKYRHIIKKE